MGRSLVVLALAVICGGAAAYGVLAVAKPRPVSDRPEMVDLVATARALSRGQVLTDKDVKRLAWPKTVLPADAITDVSEIEGRVVAVPMVAGEPVLKPKLSDEGSGLAALVPEGQRAYTIQANTAASNVAGFVRPDNIVDVLLNLRGNTNDETGGGTTTTLLQAVQILAVDQLLDEGSGKIASDLKSVTLLVTPDQAAKLALGQQQGTLSLSLRNPQDHAEAKARPATVRDIMFLQMQPEPGTKPEGPSGLDRVLGLAKSLVAAVSKPAGSDQHREAIPGQVRTLRGSTWSSVELAGP
jgi:pilus assembly protein CpaB